jgi:putative endonuclease
MYVRHVLGKKGEDIAVEYILKNKYELIERNFNCRQGEIDIIAKDKNEIVFIEVKTRTNKKYGKPIDAVTPLKIKHILNSIKYYVFINKLENTFIRIDVIEVYQKERKTYINHIKNAITM